MAKRGRDAAPPPAGGRPYPVSPHQTRPSVLPSFRFPVDHRFEDTCYAVATSLFGSLGDRSQPSAREDYLGRGSSASVEAKECGATIGGARVGAQSAVAA